MPLTEQQRTGDKEATLDFSGSGYVRLVLLQPRVDLASTRVRVAEDGHQRLVLQVLDAVQEEALGGVVRNIHARGGVRNPDVCGVACLHTHASG